MSVPKNGQRVYGPDNQPFPEGFGSDLLIHLLCFETRLPNYLHSFLSSSFVFLLLIVYHKTTAESNKYRDYQHFKV